MGVYKWKVIYYFIRKTKSNVELSNDEIFEEQEGETKDVYLTVRKKFKTQEIMNDTFAEDQKKKY